MLEDAFSCVAPSAVPYAMAPGAAQVIRFRHDDDARVRRWTETLVAELVAAEWWAQGAG